jgi:hypothetical protein
MPSSGMLFRVAHVRTGFSKECVKSNTREERISELETTSVITSNRSAANVVASSPILVILMLEAILLY